MRTAPPFGNSEQEEGVDFACLRHRLAVEVDGSQHGLPAEQARDSARSAALTKEGFLVLRFWNSDIEGNLPSVVEAILSTLAHQPPTPALRADPPPTGEG